MYVQVPLLLAVSKALGVNLASNISSWLCQCPHTHIHYTGRREYSKRVIERSTFRGYALQVDLFSWNCERANVDRRIILRSMIQKAAVCLSLLFLEGFGSSVARFDQVHLPLSVGFGLRKEQA